MVVSFLLSSGRQAKPPASPNQQIVVDVPAALDA
jgi:hypothetical protein